MSQARVLRSVPLPERPRLTHPLITERQLGRSVIIYVRQSTKGQVLEHWGSTALQHDQAQLARSYGWRNEHIIEIDGDLGTSATTTIGRSGWSDMLDKIDSGSVGAVMFVNTARLARVVGDFEDLRVLSKRNNVILFLDGRPANPADPNDTALLQISAVFAQLDNDQRAKYLRETKRRKAVEGEIVSQLPIGWVETADGSLDFDPEVKPTIDTVYSVFRSVRTLRGTVAELKRQGVNLPTRYRGGKQLKRPAIEIVRRFIINPAYAGVYLFGKSDSRPEYGIDVRGKQKRRRLPDSEWIRHENHFPAYITLAEQAEFRRQLKANAFNARERPSKGRALTQGLLVCNRCGATLTVQYPNRGAYRYQCTRFAAQYAEKPCFSICGDELDAAIADAFLRRIDGSIEDILQAALTDARDGKETEKQREAALRKHLEYVNEVAWNRYKVVDERNALVRERLEREANTAAKSLEEFNQQMAAKARQPSLDSLEDELGRLGQEVRSVAGLWAHSGVTDRERKEMLRCLIDRIVVERTDAAIEATVYWFDGTSTQSTLLHLGGIREYVRELHADGLTAKQIRDRLAAGHPVTGQKWCYTKEHIYQIFKRIGVAPNSPQSSMAGLRQEIAEMYDQGLSLRVIVERLNNAGKRTLHGLPWTQNTAWHWLDRKDRSAQLEEQHRRLLQDAKDRGLSNASAAEEFNRLGIPRVGGKKWTADAVRQRRAHMNSKAKHRRGSRSVVEA